MLGCNYNIRGNQTWNLKISKEFLLRTRWFKTKMRLEVHEQHVLFFSGMYIPKKMKKNKQPESSKPNFHSCKKLMRGLHLNIGGGTKMFCKHM